MRKIENWSIAISEPKSHSDKRCYILYGEEFPAQRIERVVVGASLDANRITTYGGPCEGLVDWVMGSRDPRYMPPPLGPYLADLADLPNIYQGSAPETPMPTELPSSKGFYSNLEPGIREAVRALRNAGINTSGYHLRNPHPCIEADSHDPTLERNTIGIVMNELDIEEWEAELSVSSLGYDGWVITSPAFSEMKETKDVPA